MFSGEAAGPAPWQVFHLKFSFQQFTFRSPEERQEAAQKVHRCGFVPKSCRFTTKIDITIEWNQHKIAIKMFVPNPMVISMAILEGKQAFECKNEPLDLGKIDLIF
jgi:hypothetical protein